MATPDDKLTNPKDLIGSSKIPLHLWPETATVLGSLALLDGLLKYGRSNWRKKGVRASIYIDAAKRHLNAWFEGEDIDPTSGLPALAHALACIAIVVDADAAGNLNDDRMVAGGYLDLVKRMTPHVDRLKTLHAGKTPKHYTIADNEIKRPTGIGSLDDLRVLASACGVDSPPNTPPNFRAEMDRNRGLQA